MSIQFFMITCAPECPPLTEDQLRHALRAERLDSEWAVNELERPTAIKAKQAAKGETP